MPGRVWLENEGYIERQGSWYMPEPNYPHLHVGFTTYAAETVHFIAFHAQGADRAVGLYNDGNWSLRSRDLRACGLSSWFIDALYRLCLEYHLGTP